MDIERFLKEKKAAIDRALNGYLPEEDHFPLSLHRAMRYSVFAGGKRLRPILTIASAEAVGGREKDVMPLACAVELIHTYSLIHDDLPAMDDDELRRGKPTCHKVFGEAIAILAGDALLTLAFGILARIHVEGMDGAGRVLSVISEIARGAGHAGMVGGQAVDIESQGKEVDFPVLEYIHIHKTGALILASIRAGAILCGASKDELDSLTRYGEAIGLAFQITDDILDVEGDVQIMGKEAGVDMARGKVTYPALLGIGESKKRVASLIDRAIEAVSSFGDRAEPLREIAEYIVKRAR